MRAGGGVRVVFSVYHDGPLGGLDQQGCRVPRWLFSHFDAEGRDRLSASFSEIPLVINAVDPARAAALANALVLLRFLGAAEDQAIAKVMLHPWDPFQGSPALATERYEERVLEFLHGEVFYPEGVTLFDVLDRRDLKRWRALAPCCQAQLGFILPILEWIDEVRPRSEAERKELEAKLRRSLADEARYWVVPKRESPRTAPPGELPPRDFR